LIDDFDKSSHEFPKIDRQSTIFQKVDYLIHRNFIHNINFAQPWINNLQTRKVL